MITIQKLVPSSELRRISTGSYEAKIEAAGAVVVDHLRETFGTSEVEVVATHSDHVVAHASGQFHRVSFQESDNGTIRVVDVAALQVETYEEPTKFATKEAERVVDLFFHGSVDQAQEKLTGIIPLVITDQKRDEAQRVEAVETLLGGDRPWRGLFNERSAQIKQFVLGDLEVLEEHRLQPKFRALYEGSIDDGKLQGYADLVEEDLEIVLDRIEAIHETTLTAFKHARPVLRESGDDAVFPMYEQFATDLIDDLGTVHETGSQAAFKIENVACRGKLRDMLAESVHNYEVASRFVVAVASRLTAEVQ